MGLNYLPMSSKFNDNFYINHIMEDLFANICLKSSKNNKEIIIKINIFYE